MARKIGSLLAILLLVVLVVLLVRQVLQTSRAGSPTQVPLSSPPDFTGWVLAVDPGSGRIKVESQADKIVRPVTMTLTREIPIFRREKGTLRQVDISEIHLQDQAELWLVGPVPGSFPAEVDVRQVIVERLN